MTVKTKMKILITGGAGYIGSHTAVVLFTSGYEPIIIDDFRNSNKSSLEGIKKITGKDPETHIGDCSDQIFLAETLSKIGKVDGVIHFAGLKAVGKSVAEPLSYYQNNINALLSILCEMKAHSIPAIIFSSSATVYGDPDNLPITENFPRKKATSPYGNTKQICEDILDDTVKSNSFPLRVVSLRYFNPIGAHPSGHIGELPIGAPNNLVPYLTQAAAGKRKELTVFGNDYPTPDGTGIRDYIHVMDMAEAHVAALSYLLSEKKSTSNLYDIFNVGTGSGTSVLELISKFEEINATKVPHIIGPRRSGDIASCYADASKIKRALGWSAKRSISEALKDAWNWEKKS